jgi:hypothetical protein
MQVILYAMADKVHENEHNYIKGIIDKLVMSNCLSTCLMVINTMA